MITKIQLTEDKMDVETLECTAKEAAVKMLGASLWTGVTGWGKDNPEIISAMTDEEIYQVSHEMKLLARKMSQVLKGNWLII